MKKKKKRCLKPEVKGLLIFVIVLFSLVAVYSVYREMTEFVFEEDLEETVLTINDTVISLKEISYYVIRVEEDGNEYAMQYNPDNPEEYWGLYMNQATESGYITNLAKDAALNYCIRDNIYYQEAAAEGLELTAEEKEEVRNDAESEYFSMSLRQREMTQLTPKELEQILTKAAIARKYMFWMAEQDEEASVLEMITLYYDVGGSYYEQVKTSYAIEVNEKIWSQIHPGHVTIN